jgi:RNA polymerase sigma factor (sigma-70 family)
MDDAIVRAAQGGDLAALAAVVDEFTPTVLAVAYGLCGDRDDTADIAQESFATMVVRIGDLRDPAALPGWLLAIVRSSARRHRRLAGTEHLVGAGVAQAARRSTTTAAADDGVAPAPDEVVVAHDEARRLRAAVEALPPDLRLPMVLHYFAGHPLDDIAGLCDLPLSTVKQRMRVARTRLRGGIDHMSDATASQLRAPDAEVTDTIRMYTAMRTGDVGLVTALLDARPELVDVREGWSRAESFAHRLPWTRGGGTPLLRAVERDDLAMVRLLLARGADPDGSCTCDGAESPLWVAVVQRESAIVDELLARGADPDASAFAGVSALEVARRRGYDEIAARLVDAGATDDADAGVAPLAVAGRATGIKAIDLWCPFPRSGLVHLTPGFGLGAVVLVAELSLRAAGRGEQVVWTGFVQAPTDLGDLRHVIAEADLRDRVTLSMAPPSAPHDEQVAAIDRAIASLRDSAFAVVFAETGHQQAIDERLGRLAGRDGVTLVVAPLDGSVEPPAPRGSPYQASIVFDVERARRGRWPAVGADSWSKVADPELAALADLARHRVSDELDAYLAQPFVVAEPMTGRPGEVVPVDELRRRVAELVDAASVPTEMGT